MNDSSLPFRRLLQLAWPDTVRWRALLFPEKNGEKQPRDRGYQLRIITCREVDIFRNFFVVIDHQYNKHVEYRLKSEKVRTRQGEFTVSSRKFTFSLLLRQYSTLATPKIENSILYLHNGLMISTEYIRTDIVNLV